MTGLNQTDLPAAVLPVSGRRRSLLPQGISPAQERALLRACDRRRGTGRRDYAVIVLMLRLGLSASEVAVLALDDLDWRAGLLTVHGKRAQVDQLPLPADVGEGAELLETIVGHRRAQPAGAAHGDSSDWRRR